MNYLIKDYIREVKETKICQSVAKDKCQEFIIST